MAAPQRYSVVVAKEYLKFSAAHFIAYPGFREPLHGHNYQVSVRVDVELGPEGYVLDFGLVKRTARALCEELDERVIVPRESESLTVREADDGVEVTTEDGVASVFRAQTCSYCRSRTARPRSWPRICWVGSASRWRPKRAGG